MSYQVLARKWRPQTFDDIVGQEHVTTTLGNALSRGRVAHAYLFTGPRGCGKTTMARLMAKALNCDEGPTPTPCGACPSCLGIAEGTVMDVLEIDAASHTGVDNIRELRENAQYQPTAGKKRIFIIDEVHMLSKGAFNALLKTLEEPPEHVHFIFATTEPSRIPRTILSRCQRFDFRLFTLEEIHGRLATIVASEERPVDDEALELLAAMAEGSMRDGLSLLDQAFSSVEGTLGKDDVMGLFGLVGPDSYLALIDAVLARDSRAALDLVDELTRSGFDLVEFARGLVGYFRDLMLLRLDEELAARVEKPEAVKQRMQEQATRFHPQDLLYLTQLAAENYGRLERAPHPRWLLEAQVMEYTRMESRILLSEILGRLDGSGEGSLPQGGTQGNKRGGGSQAKPKPKPKAKTEAKTKAKPAQAGQAASERASATARPAARVESQAPGFEARVQPVESSAPLVESSTRAGEDLAECFRRFASTVRGQNMGVGTCLVEAAPVMNGECLQLKFGPDHEFHRQQLSDAKTLQWLSGLTAECFGRCLKVELVDARPEAGEESLRAEVQREVAPTAQQELDRLSQENPALGHLLDGLGGRIVEDDSSPSA